MFRTLSRPAAEAFDDVTSCILEQMRLAGRQDLTAWDVNTGYCEEWAVEAQRRFGGVVVWFDEILRQDPLDCDFSHAVLQLNEYYFDSQTPQGVRCIKEMDVYQGVSRDVFLRKREVR